ncbi:DUF5684 domain-containing protein, partial [Microbacterium sp. 18062]|uniref:DUF5684 domain-containing protein n=1 Tax=Microbacterium sp. 18062 TaxID=2681410 RepID=UPI001F2A0BEA
MLTEASTVLVAVISIAALVAVALVAGLHIWYAMGLARVFAGRETETWRAWVPLLNEAEVLRLGRVDPVKAALYLVPVVAVYAIVLKAIAAHRLNVEAGRGAGSTVLAVLLPPVWAMLLGQDRPATTPSTGLDEVPAPAPGVAFP